MQLKWPNDLLFDNAKCAGILVETSASSGGAFACVLGFGANIKKAPVIEDRKVTCLERQSIPATPLELLSELDRSLRKGFAKLSTPDGFEGPHRSATDYIRSGRSEPLS